jgi:Domain of unknown function (DUF4390)
MIRRALPLAALLFAAPAFLGAAGDTVRVTPLARDGQVYVSFSLEGGLTPDMRETIRSGLQTTFAYDVELRRGVAIWFDPTLAAATVTATVQFDNLTRRHQLSRAIDGRVDAAQVTESEEEVERWMTSVDHLPLFTTDDLEATAEYYVRVRARTRPRSTWSLWPWGGGQWGHATFTFIP